MEILALREGLILIKPILKDSISKFIIVKDDKAFRNGVVQSIGALSPEHTGFIEGDTVFYTQAIHKFGEFDVVNLENVLMKCQE